MKFLLSVFVLSAALLCGAQAPSWIWYPEKPQDNTARAFRKTFQVDGGVKSAQLLVLADDGAEIRINGAPEKPLPGWLKFSRHDVTERIRQGRNVISVRARNGRAEAGLLCRFEVFTDGGIVEVNTGADWKTSAEFPAGWEEPGFDDSGWKSAKRLGGANLSPWNRLADVTPFLVAGPAKRAQIPAEKRGRIMLDDFSDLSSWMGWPLRGMRPGHNVLPYQLGFGAGPDASRDDGGTGMIDYDFVKPGGLIVFEKNSVYKNPAVAEAIEFDANPQGYECEVYFELMDRSDKAKFRTLPVKLSGNAWKRYRLELNEKTVENFDSLVFPVAVRQLCFAGGGAGKGRVLLDDLCFIADLSDGNGAVTIHPEYDGLAHAPDRPVRQGYRIRNNWSRPVETVVSIDVFDIADRKLFSAKKTVKIGAYGVGRVSFDVGRFARKGSYRTEVKAENPSAKQSFTGWFGVFEPNNRRLNGKPMWFGVEDQGLRNFRYEEELHVGWMKMLGIDIIRGNAIGSQLEQVPFTDFGYEQYREMYRPHFDAGILLLFSYAGEVPGWTGRKPFASDKEAFAKHMTRVAEFMARHPGIRYFEWFNEPNLGFFREAHTTGEYLASQRAFYPIFKKLAPEVKVATGGVVINHARARKDFAKRMYQENSDFYDVACYHGHEGYAAHLKSLETLDGWLAEAKLSKPFGNSEAGARSYYTHPDMFRLQAAELVRKITLTKSRNSEFYIWFMLHDYGDKYINADDSFGLVTVDNQPKPSFLAYNELIRQLANTDPAEPVALDKRLQNYRFIRGDEEIFVCWPQGGAFSFALRSAKPFVRTDLFGNETEVRPSGGIAFVNCGELPFYLRAPKGALSAVELPLRVIGVPVFVPGEKGAMELELVNPYNGSFQYAVSAGNVERKGRLRSGGVFRFRLPVTVPEDAAFGITPLDCRLKLTGKEGGKLLDESISLDRVTALPVGENGFAAVWLDRADQVREMMFDPNTPRWSGPEDLSAEIRLSRRGSTLVFDAVVTDDDHSAPGKDAYVWQNDCIQVGIANAENAHYEFTVSGDGRGKAAVWSHIHPGESGGMIGSAWDVPATVKRNGNKTVYHFEIPAALAGLKGEPGEAFRIAFLVNDNDRGRHLRFMEWNGGIQPSKNINLFGWAKFVR